MRILIAEDDRITRMSLARQLERWGHEVVAAEDGEEAWKRFGGDSFDIVVTDWEMPGLSGVELVQRIRASNPVAYVYVILLTSRSDKADIVRGIEAGADDFVSKPFDREELRVRLLAGERVVRLERKLVSANAELTAAGERMRHDLRAAARVQHAMLPRQSIVTPRTRTAWTYVPTDELAGDAVGLELLADRYLVAYVADVSGHGVPAALLSVTAMHILSPGTESGVLTQQGASGAAAIRAPGQIIGDLNRRFCASDNDGRFITLVLCVLDLETGLLRFSRAGHPLPLLLRGGRVIAIDTDGSFPVGIIAQAEYDEVELTLQQGDRLILISDGVFEQLSAATHQQFGLERFQSLMIEKAAEPPESAASSAIEALTDWAGRASFEDDVSVVIIDWLGAGS